jgi:hypothetical protein
MVLEMNDELSVFYPVLLDWISFFAVQVLSLDYSSDRAASPVDGIGHSTHICQNPLFERNKQN